MIVFIILHPFSIPSKNNFRAKILQNCSIIVYMLIGYVFVVEMICCVIQYSTMTKQRSLKALAPILLCYGYTAK